MLEENPVLEFVLWRLPLGVHVPCEALAELWGEKAIFRKRLLHFNMEILLGEFGVYISVMNIRGRVKGIVLLGPGVAKPLNAGDQPLGSDSDLLRTGNPDRVALMKTWLTQRGTARKLRVGAEGTRTWTPERTPGRSFCEEDALARGGGRGVAAARAAEEEEEEAGGVEGARGKKKRVISLFVLVVECKPEAFFGCQTPFS